MFPVAKSDAFLQLWPKYELHLREILTQDYKLCVQTIWPKEIENILVLLKLFPAKSVGRNTSNILSFNKAVDKLIIFHEVRNQIFCWNIMY